MRHLVFGDMHGKRINELESVIDSEKIDSFICLGDFDQVNVIKDVIDLEKRFNADGKSSIIVPGNHDYAIFHNKDLYSGTLDMQDKTVFDLYSELHHNSEAKEYISYLLNKTHGVETNIGNNSTYVVHGGLDGSLMSYFRCPEEIEDLWFRIDYGDMDYPKNFSRMKENGYNLLLRGHDHHRLYGYEVSGNTSFSEFVTKGGKFELKDSERHVVNPGAWFNGDYLIIDDSENNVSLDYKNIND
ncbi:hypothetical protein HOD61_01225 [archaeon]|jgi:predicted phosphodiesterase|nr:hypothetical protein [archaeon]